MYHTNVRSFLIVSALCAAYAAIVPGSARADLHACFAGCQALVDALPESDTPPSSDEILTRCQSEVPACAELDSAARTALPGLCDSLHGVRPRTPTDSFCVLPDGVSHDEARHRCRCPASAPYALPVARHRSARLPIEGLESGDQVFVCYDPMALRGAPGSSDERLAAVERSLTDAFAAIDELCHPHDGESRSTACARAYEEFRAIGSGDGPVDLEPLRARIAEIEATDQRQDAELERLDHAIDDLRETESADMLGTRAAIHDLAQSHAILLQCLRGGDPHLRVTWTGPGHPDNPDGTPDTSRVVERTESLECGDILAAADRHTVDTVRSEIGPIVRDAVREELSRVSVDGGHAFAWVQAYGLVGFNPLTYGNVPYGNLWQIGGELTLGVGLGGGWNFHGGVGVAYGGPNITGATNVAGEMRVGLGTFVIPEIMVGFGLFVAHRFTPDVFSAESLYGFYLDGTIRFMPRSEWTPMLTFRVAGGGSPRQVQRGWEIQADGMAQILFGIGHF